MCDLHKIDCSSWSLRVSGDDGWSCMQTYYNFYFFGYFLTFYNNSPSTSVVQDEAPEKSIQLWVRISFSFCSLRSWNMQIFKSNIKIVLMRPNEIFGQRCCDISYTHLYPDILVQNAEYMHLYFQHRYCVYSCSSIKKDHTFLPSLDLSNSP